MDAPVWSNDILYFWEFVATIMITLLMVGVCFYISRNADHRRAARKSAISDQPAAASDHSQPMRRRTITK